MLDIDPIVYASGQLPRPGRRARPQVVVLSLDAPAGDRSNGDRSLARERPGGRDRRHASGKRVRRESPNAQVVACHDGRGDAGSRGQSRRHGSTLGGGTLSAGVWDGQLPGLHRGRARRVVRPGHLPASSSSTRIPEESPCPVLGLSVWDVGLVYRDPCHWQGQGFDPGPSVGDLVAWLVAQKMRNATAPTYVTLAGYAGKDLEWSAPWWPEVELRGPAFDACDLDLDGCPSRLPRALVLETALWSTAMRRSRARSTSCGSSTSTGSDWWLTPPTHRTPPQLTGRSWSKS